VPRNERLRQADLGDELRDRRRAGRQPLDDAQAIDVGECLVDETKLAQLIGLEDGIREGAADPGRGWGQGRLLRTAIVSTAVYINRR
jgi:hypothetical protein